jgi:hypothetical protein
MSDVPTFGGQHGSGSGTPPTPPDGTRPVPVVDLGLDDIEPAHELDTPLDDVIAELTQPVADVERVVPVRGRPGWALIVNIDFPFDDLKLWRKKATTKPAKGTRPAEIDELRVACTVLAARTVGLTRNGQPILAAGEPATFGSDAFLRALGQDRPIEAVRAVFGLDGHVLGAASYIVDEAGYGEQGDPGDTVADELGEDPTTRGSRDFSA